MIAHARWTRAELTARDGWTFAAPAALAGDAGTLARWADTQPDPIAAYAPGVADVPVVRALGRRLAAELLDAGGSGVAWLRGMPSVDEGTLRLLFLAVGCELGAPVETYGRLYDVRDQGGSYRDRAIPVSQTREATGMHTDSSARSVCPRVVGLCCVRPARTGGGSRIASAVEVHERLRGRAPELLGRLYRDFVRDIITPGSDRTPAEVARNAFPVYARAGDGLRFRYMRYWIERGSTRAGAPLGDDDRAAFDVLDEELGSERNTVRFSLDAGDFLFIDNTTIAHDRDAYDEDPAAQRLMLRLWLSDAR